MRGYMHGKNTILISPHDLGWRYLKLEQHGQVCHHSCGCFAAILTYESQEESQRV